MDEVKLSILSVRGAIGRLPAQQSIEIIQFSFLSIQKPHSAKKRLAAGV